MNNFIPPEIMNAAETLLEPYGIRLAKLLKQEEPPIQWETTEQAAKRLGVNKMTVYRLALTGNVETGRCTGKSGSHFLLNAKSLDEYLKKNAKETQNG